MKCPSCATEIRGGVGARCPRCGWVQPGVGVTPMEVVVRVTTGVHRIEGDRPRMPNSVRVLYAAGLLMWLMPTALVLYFRANPMPDSSTAWRALGIVLAALLAAILHSVCWAGAFFYGRLVTSDQIAREAERTTQG